MIPTLSCFRTRSGYGPLSPSVPRRRSRSTRPWCTNVARLGPSVGGFAERRVAIGALQAVLTGCRRWAQLGLRLRRPAELAPAAFRRDLREASWNGWRRPSDAPHAEMAES